MMGASNNPYYDGTAFAKDGVILVSINYRLHALGFYSSKYTYKSTVPPVTGDTLI